MNRERLAAGVLAVILSILASTQATGRPSRRARAPIPAADTLRVTSPRPAESEQPLERDWFPGWNEAHSVLVGFDDLPAGCSWVDRAIGDTLAFWQVGDQIDLRVLPETEVDSSYVVNYVPCDPFTVHATLGEKELPPALEWELLGLGSDPVLWEDDLAFPASALDSRFKTCAPDAKGWLHIRVTVLGADTTGRSIGRGPMARLRKAVRTYRELRYADTLSLLQNKSVEGSEDVLAHYLLAGAFENLGRCQDHVREEAWLVSRRYGCKDFSVIDASARCEKMKAWRAVQPR